MRIFEIIVGRMLYILIVIPVLWWLVKIAYRRRMRRISEENETEGVK